MTLGEIIKAYRLEHKISQDIIAERSRLSKAYISILERNINPKTNEPPVATPKTINAIAAAINSDFDTIFNLLDDDLKISIGEQMPNSNFPSRESLDRTYSQNALKVAEAYDKADAGTQTSVRKLLDIPDLEPPQTPLPPEAEAELANYRRELEAEQKGKTSYPTAEENGA